MRKPPVRKASLRKSVTRPVLAVTCLTAEHGSRSPADEKPKPHVQECYLLRAKKEGREGGRNEKKRRDWWSHLNYKYVPGIQNRNTGLLPGTKVGFGSRPRGTSAAAPARKPDCFVIQITVERSNSIGYEHRFPRSSTSTRWGLYANPRALSTHSVYVSTHMWLCKPRPTQHALAARWNLIRALFIMRRPRLDLALCHISAIQAYCQRRCCFFSCQNTDIMSDRATKLQNNWVQLNTGKGGGGGEPAVGVGLCIRPKKKKPLLKLEVFCSEA